LARLPSSEPTVFAPQLAKVAQLLEKMTA